MDEKKRSPLHVVQEEQRQESPPAAERGSDREGSPQSKRQRIRGFWERLWLTDPEQAATLSGSFEGYLEKERLESIWSLLQLHGPYLDKRVVDLGSGVGHLALRLQEAGAEVDVVDLSNQALRHLESRQQTGKIPLRAIRAYVPYTELEDATYDFVFCTGLIGDLPREEQRLLISELYRLSKAEGFILIANSLDTTTDGALDQWHHLIETELEIVSEAALYNAYFDSLLRLSSKFPHPFYRLHNWLKRTGWGCKWLARRCHLFREENGVSHVATLARRKPLQYSGEVQATPLSDRDQRLKRRIWE